MDGREHPRALLGARAELELGLLGVAEGEHRRIDGRLAPRALRLGRRDVAPVVVGIRVVQAGPPAVVVLVVGVEVVGVGVLAFALQRGDVAEPRPGAAGEAAERGGHGRRTARGLRHELLDGGAGDEQQAEHQQCDEDDDRAGVGDEAAQRLADDRAEPAAGGAEGVEVGHELLGPAHDVQQAEHGQRRERPAEHEPGPVVAATLVHERAADADERDGHDVPPEAGEPADQRLDAAAERPGHVEVDREADEDAGDDETDADELVLATVDRLAEVGRGRGTPGAARAIHAFVPVGAIDPLGAVGSCAAVRDEPPDEREPALRARSTAWSCDPCRGHRWPSTPTYQWGARRSVHPSARTWRGESLTRGTDAFA